MFAALVWKIQLALRQAGLFDKAIREGNFERAVAHSREQTQLFILCAQNHHGQWPLHTEPIEVSPRLRQIFVTINYGPNRRGVCKVFRQYLRGQRTVDSLVEILQSGNFPTKRIREERANIELEASRKRTRRVATSVCPRCNHETLITRVFQAAEKGSCGGKATLQSQERCTNCGYECRS